MNYFLTSLKGLLIKGVVIRLLPLFVYLISAETPISTVHFIYIVQAVVISEAIGFIIWLMFLLCYCFEQSGVTCLACNPKARICYLGCLLSKTRVVVSKVSQRVCEMLSRICIVIASVAI